MNDNTVTADMLFTEKIKHLRQRARFKYTSQFILYALCCFLLLHGLVLAAGKSGLYHFERGILFYVSFGVIALFVAAGVLYIRKKTFPHLLIEIDERFGLQDRLSTAYEYHRNEKESIFSASLQEDAVRSLKHFGIRELLPLSFSRVYLALIFAGLLNLLPLFVDDPSQDITSALKAQATEQSRERDAAQTPEQRKQRNESIQEKKEKDAGYKRMRELAEKLQQKPLPQKERAERLQEMLQEVQAMQEHLSNSASQEDGSTTIENLPIRQLPQQQRMMNAGLGKLQDLLETMSSENASGTFDNSQEFPPELQEQLSELLEELDGRQSDSSQEAQKRNDDAEGPESSSGAYAGREGDQEGRQDESAGDGNDEDRPSGRQGGRMSEADREGDMNDSGRMGGDRSRVSVGSGASDGEEYPPSVPETSDNLVRQDKIRPAERDQYNAHIRSVTEIGKAGLPEEEPAARPYQREVESVLQQEEMPLNYREYIKNYFLSIGLTEE